MHSVGKTFEPSELQQFSSLMGEKGPLLQTIHLLFVRNSQSPRSVPTPLPHCRPPPCRSIDTWPPGADPGRVIEHVAVSKTVLPTFIKVSFPWELMDPGQNFYLF